MSQALMRLLIEGFGWVLIAIGAYSIFNDPKSVSYYIILVVGIIIVLAYIPYKDFRGRRKK